MASRANVKTLVVVCTVFGVIFLVYMFGRKDSSLKKLPADNGNSDTNQQREELGRSNRAGGPGAQKASPAAPVEEVKNDEKSELSGKIGVKDEGEKSPVNKVDKETKNSGVAPAGGKPKFEEVADKGVEMRHISSNTIHIVSENNEARQDRGHHTVMRDGIPQGVLTREEVWMLRDIAMNGGKKNKPTSVPHATSNNHKKKSKDAQHLPPNIENRAKASTSVPLSDNAAKMPEKELKDSPRVPYDNAAKIPEKELKDSPRVPYDNAAKIPEKELKDSPRVPYDNAAKIPEKELKDSPRVPSNIEQQPIGIARVPSDTNKQSMEARVPSNNDEQVKDKSQVPSNIKRQTKEPSQVLSNNKLSVKDELHANVLATATPDHMSENLATTTTDTLVQRENAVPDGNFRQDFKAPVTSPGKMDEATPLPAMPTFYPSKDLFIRAVYFDDRPRDGHQNTSVFLVVCVKDITDNNLIVGCQVGNKEAAKFSVKLIGETPLWRAFYPQINHEEVLIHCYDLPVKNGSDAYIKYKLKKTSDVVTAASERPLYIPPPRIKPTSHEGVKYDMTIVTCAKIFKNPPWLEEWLTYQRTLGVDHVHLDAEDSFVKAGGMQKPFVKQMIKEGYLTVDIWNEYLGMWEIWYHNQGLVYEDCPYRFRGVYDYIVMLDTDDFFTPREPQEPKLHYYINKYCRQNNIGSCKFRWVEYFPDDYGFNNKSTSDGNITRALRSYSHYNQGNPKSLHQTTALIDTATHYAYLMMPKYKIFQVPVNVAYVAHVRKWKKVPSMGLVEGIPNVCLDHCISRIFVAVLASMVLFVFSLLG